VILNAIAIVILDARNVISDAIFTKKVVITDAGYS
jgi:hypothetical protein